MFLSYYIVTKKQDTDLSDEVINYLSNNILILSYYILI